jgi:hypothetical protein
MRAGCISPEMIWDGFPSRRKSDAPRENVWTRAGLNACPDRVPEGADCPAAQAVSAMIAAAVTNERLISA